MSAITPAARRSWTTWSDRRLAYAFVLPSAVLLLSLSVYPFVQAAYDSLFHLDLVTRSGPFVGLRNYLQLVQSAEVRAAVGRTIVWTLANVAVQTVLGMAIALLLNARLRGQTVARGLVLFPYMVPAIVAALIFRFMFNDTVGVVNYVLLSTHIVSQPVSWLSSLDTALPAAIAVNCWKYTPFMVIVFLARLQTVPRELYDAARIDGASALGVFRYITLPWTTPVILIAMLLRTIWTVNDFDLIYLLAFGGPLGATTTVPIEIRALAFDNQDIGLASSLAICGAIVLCIAAWGYLRAYRRSETQLN
jgi:multiple sugar transport system permease protein